MKKKLGYLDRRIKKTSRRKQWIAIAVFIVLALQAISQIYAITFKPEQIPELISTEQISPNVPIRAKITPKDISKFVITESNSSSKIIFIQSQYGEYVPVLIRVNPFKEIKEYYGIVSMITAEEKDSIVTKLVELGAEEADAREFVPMYYMYHQYLPEFEPIVAFAIAFGLVWSAGLWYISRRNKKKPYTHAVYKAFAREGGELENLEQFESELSDRNVPEFSRLIISEHWLFYNGHLKLKLRNISEVVCIFKTKTRAHSFLTRWMSKKQDVVIGFLDKKQWNINFGKNNDVIETFKSIMKNRLPYIVCDDNDKLNNEAWSRNPDIILDRVVDNRFRAKNEKNKKSTIISESKDVASSPQAETETETKTETKTDPTPESTQETQREIRPPDSTPQTGWTRRPPRHTE